MTFAHFVCTTLLHCATQDSPDSIQVPKTGLNILFLQILIRFQFPADVNKIVLQLKYRIENVLLFINQRTTCI